MMPPQKGWLFYKQPKYGNIVSSKTKKIQGHELKKCQCACGG